MCHRGEEGCSPSQQHLSLTKTWQIHLLPPAHCKATFTGMQAWLASFAILCVNAQLTAPFFVCVHPKQLLICQPPQRL